MPPPPLRLPSAGAGTPVLVILGVGSPAADEFTLGSLQNPLGIRVYTHTPPEGV